MERDYKNNNIFYENTEDLNIGKTNQKPAEVEQSTPKFSIKLDKDEEAARQQGFLNFNSGVSMIDTSEYSKSDIRSTLGSRTTVNLSGTKEDTGTYNTTQALAEDYASQEEEYITSGRLWEDVYGSTAYADLKHKCGLSKTDSYTDYYNKTGYIPKGYEIEAKLLLAEEKRMNYYMEYKKGSISKSDFLYQAYGKDLMKENGYDLSSPLFWYNKAKKNDFTNPLDSDTFLSQLITDSEKLWQAETWYQAAATRNIGSTLAGLSTGSELSEESFQNVFREQVAALKPYFDNDVKKIMTYYQAGFLGSAFSPMVDIDGDGKYDYYYHSDGKLYAVDGSSGTGSSTCSIVYNDDGSVHSVQVHEAVDGWLDSLWDGFTGFFIGFADLFALIPGLINTDAMANYEAWKKRTIADEDRVVFDSMDKWNGDDWGNAVAEGVGTIAGMVLLLIATWGIGNAISAGGEAAKAGAKAGADAAIKITSQETAAAFTENIAKEAASKFTSKAAQRAFMDNALKAATKEISKNVALDAAVKTALKEGAKDIGASVARATAANIGRNVAAAVVGKGGFTSTISQAKGGTLLNTTLTKIAQRSSSTGLKKIVANAWVRSGLTATELAVRDYITVTTQLKAKNKALQYLEYATNGQVKALSDGEIAGRAWLVAGTDLIISTMFRAVGSQGATSRFVKDSDNLLKNINANTADVINRYAQHLKTYCRIDAAFDIFENITTSAVQAAASNPYANIGSEESWATAMQSIVNPAFIASNLYATYNNLVSWGGRNGAPISTSIYDDRIEAIARQINISASSLGDQLDTLSEALVAKNSNVSNVTEIQESLDRVKQKTMETLNNASNSKIDNLLQAAQDLDTLFTEDVVAANKKEILDSFNITLSEYNQIKALIKTYNENNPDKPIGLITGKVFYSAQKENDANVAKAYKAALDLMTKRSAELKAKEEQVANIFLKGARFVMTKANKVSLNYINELIDETTFKTSGVHLEERYKKIVNTFVAKRFKMLTDVTEEGNEELRNKELAELETYLNSEYFKFHSLSTSSATADVSYTMVPVYDDKDNTKIKTYKLESTATGNNIIIKLLSNYDKNKAAIEALCNKYHLIDVVKNSDGTLTINTANMAPWYALELDNSKNNQLLADISNNKYLKIFKDVIDSVAYMFENSDLNELDVVDYDEPLLLKLRVATGNTNGSNEQEYITIYLIPSKISGNIDTGTSYGDVANRLMALQGILYSTYGLFKQAADGVVDNESAVKYLAQLGALLTEEKAMDPFYDFLKLFNSDNEEERRLAIEENLPKAVMAILSRCKFNMVDGKEPSDSVLTRKQLLTFVKAGVFGEKGEYALLNKIITDNSSGKNGNASANNIAKIAQEILDYVNAVDKIDGTLKILNDYAESTKTDLSANEISKLEDCVKTLKNNKDLADSLNADGMLPDTIKGLLKESTLENFWQGSQKRDSHLEALSRNLLRLSDRSIQNQEELKTLLKKFLDEDLMSIQIVKDNPFELSKQFLIRYFKSFDSYKNSFDSFKKVSYFLEALNTSDFKDFLKNPTDFINDFNTKNSAPGYNIKNFTPDLKLEDFGNLFITNARGVRKTDYNFLLGLTLINKFRNDLSKDNFIEASISDTDNYLISLYSTVIKDPNSVEFQYISRLYKIATDKDLNINMLSILDPTAKNYNRPFHTLTVHNADGTTESFGDLIYKSNKAASVLVESVVDDAIESKMELLQDGIDYYWRDTTVTPKQNVIEIDMLNFLPANLRIALKSFLNSSDLATKMGAEAKIKSEELVKEFKNLLAGHSSNATYSQYKAYKVLLSDCLASGNFILRYNIDNAASMNSLKVFLTSCGYDNFDVDAARNGISEIEGLNFKTVDTHNINSTLAAEKFYRAARLYKTKYGIAKPILGEKIKKNYTNVLFNLFSGITKFNDDTNIKLLDEDGKAIPYYSIIYKKTDPNKAYTFVNAFGNTEQARSEKGTLSGGAQTLQYINKYRGLGIDVKDGNLSLDSKSLKSFTIVRLAEKTADYLNNLTGKQAQTIQVTIPKDEQDTFKEMYKDGKGFFKIMGKPEGDTFRLEPTYKTAEEFLAYVNEEGFDIRQVLPVVWNNDKSIKNTEFRAYEYISNETLFSELANLKIEGLKTIDDFINFQPIPKDEIYSFDSKEYSDFCLAHSDKNVGNILQDLSDIKNNYYLACLKYELDISKAYSDYAISYLNQDADLIDLANPRIYKILGSLLNDGSSLDEYKFSYLLNKNYTITEDDVNKLLKALNEGITNSENIFPEQATGTDNVDTKNNFTSLDVEKLNSSNNIPSDIKKETIAKLLDVLRHSEDYLITRLSEPVDLVQPDNLISCLALFCENSEGSLSIPMEYLMRSSKKQREAFFTFLNAIIANPTEYNFSDNDIKKLNDLITLLNTKIDLMLKINPTKDVDVKPARVIFEKNAVSAPRVGVEPKAGFLSNGTGKLSNVQLQKITDYIVAAENNKVDVAPFIKLSSINPNDSVVETPFKHSLIKLLNATVCKNSDKPGSTMVYNMDSDEAIVNALVSVLAFTENTKLLLQDLGVPEIQNIPLDILMELGLKANLLTTGADYQAEFASSLILKWNKETNEYSIVPLRTSSSDTEQSLYRYFLGLKTGDSDVNDITLKTINEDIANNPTHYFLLSSSKNAFLESPDGYNETTRLLYLNDINVQKSLRENMVKKAIIARDGFVLNVPGENDLMNLLDSYYNVHAVTTYDVWRNVVDSLRTLGVSDSVADLLYPTVESLYVGNPSSLNDQWVQDTLAEFIESYKGKVPSVQFKTFSDAIAWGITNRVLKAQDIAALKNNEFEIETAYREAQLKKGITQKEISNNTERVEAIIDSIKSNDTDVINYVKQNIESLDKDTQVYLIQKLLLDRKDGFDLYAILNMSSKNKTLFDISESIRPTINNELSNDWVHSPKNKSKNITATNVVSDTNHVVYDAEWFIPENGKKNSFTDVYQIGLCLRKAVNDKDKAGIIDSDTLNNLEKHNILIKKNIMNNKNKLYVEAKDSYDAKIKACTSGKDTYVDLKTNVTYHIIDGGPNSTLEDDVRLAYATFTKILKDNDVSVIMSYGGKNDNREEISDNNLIRHWLGDAFFNDVDELDILNDVAYKVWSRTTEDMTSYSMDSMRREGKINLNKSLLEHDAVSDSLDEYELFVKIINNKINIDNLYLKPLSDIAELFGEDADYRNWSDDFKNTLKAVKFNELKDITDNLKDIISKIDIDTSAFTRSNEAIKSVMDAYKLTFEHVWRRMEFKDLEKVRNNFLDIYDSSYNSTYFASIKNKKHRTEVRNILLGIVNEKYDLNEGFSAVLERDPITNKFRTSDIKGVENLKTALKYMTSILAEAVRLYKEDTKNPYNPKYISNRNKTKSFYSEDSQTIARYIAEAKTTFEVTDLDSRRSKRSEFKQNEKTLTQAVINSKFDLDNNTSEALRDIYSMLRDEPADLLSLKDYKHTVANQDFYIQIARPLANVLGINVQDSDATASDEVVSKTFSDKLRAALFNDLLSVYGRTNAGKKTHEQIIKDNTYNGIRHTLIDKADTYKKGMIETFTSSKGLFTGNLRTKTALWSMGHERYKKTMTGEYGTLYIGEKLLTSKKAFKDLFGMYKATYKTDSNGKQVVDYDDNNQNTFYTLVWRQPLQQETPIQLMKVKVVDGDTFSMTTTTADNFFNGDFDGDQYFFSHPSQITNTKEAKKLFELQNKQTELFYNLFKKDNKLMLTNQILLEEKYRNLARDVFLSGNVQSAFKAIFDSIELSRDSTGKATKIKDLPIFLGDATLIDKFKQEYYKSFDTIVTSKEYNNLSAEDRDTLRDAFLENFGVRIIKTSKGTTVLSDNPFYREDRDTTMRLKATRKFYMLDNLSNSGMDAPENGQMAKNYKWQKGSVDMNEAYRLFYNSTFSLKEDDLHLFSNLLAKKGNSLSSAKINNYLDSLSSLIGKDMVDWAKEYVDKEIITYVEEQHKLGVKDAQTYNIVVRRLSNLSNAIQQNIIASKEYNDVLNALLPKVLAVGNEEDYQKYKALHSFMYNEGYISDKDPRGFSSEVLQKPEGDKLNNGIDILIEDTYLFNKLFDDEQRKGYINTVSNDSGTLQDLYLNFIFRGDNKNANFEYRDGAEILTRDTITSLKGKGNKLLGLGSAYVAIDISEDGSLTDTIALFNNGQNSLSFTKPVEINFSGLTKKQKDNLLNLIKNTRGDSIIKSEDISRALNTNFDNKPYQIAGFVDSVGNSLLNNLNNLSPSTLNHAKLILLNRTPLYAMLETNEIKLGMVGSKALKGTVMNGLNLEDRGENTISVKDSKKNKDIVATAKDRTKAIRPDLAISASLFKDINSDYNLDYEEVLTTTDGRYRIIKVNDLAILNALNLDAQDRASERYIDTIGIVQGAHGTGSLFSYGNMFLRFDADNNKWEFDPQGYNELKDRLHYHNLESSYMDGNGARNVRLLRIAYLLDALSEDKRQRVCMEILNNTSVPTTEATLEYIYSAGDLGGDFGENLEAHICDQLSKEEFEKLALRLNSTSNKNLLGRVAFSEEMNDQLVNRYATFFNEDVNNPIIKKHQKPSDNVRVSNVRNYSDNADYLARREGSTHDTNTSYVSKISLLRTILEENGGFLNLTTLKSAADEDIINIADGSLGTLYNGYKFTDARESLALDPYDEEKQSSKKAGNKEPYSQYNEVRDNQRLIPLLSKSVLSDSYKDSLANANADILLNNNLYQDAAAYNQARFMLPFFSEGTDSQIYDATNLFSNRFVDSLHQKYPTMNEEGQLRIGTKTFKPEVDKETNMLSHLTMEEEEQRIIQNSKSPKQVKLLLEKNKEITDQLTKEDYETLGLTDQLAVADLISKTSNSKVMSFLNELCKEYDIKTEYENYNTTPVQGDPFSLLRAIRRDNNDVLHVAEFYSDDNGVKLVNSWLRSWGFKSSDNRDISLGNQTINARNKFADIKDQLLGDDYALLMYNAKHNKASYMLLNQYMNAEELIEAYDELTYRQDIWVKTLGRDKYTEYLNEVNRLIDGDINSIRNKQQEILKSHPTLSILVKAASRINKRLMLETRAQDPYAFLGWFTDLDYGTKTHLMGYKNVQIKTFVKNDFIKGLNFDLEKMPESKLASIFHSKDYGYVPMVEKIASQLAAAKTTDSLAKYMKSAGYMQNVDTFNIAMDTLQQTLDKYFESYISEPGNDRENNNRATYDTLVQQCSLAGIDMYDVGEYVDESSIYDLFKYLYRINVDNKERLGMAGLGSADYTQELYQRLINANDSQKNIYKTASKTNEILLSMTSVLVNMMEELDSNKTLLKDINNSLLKLESNGKVLVDRYGQKVNKGKLINDYSSWHIFEDFLHLASRDLDNRDYLSTYIAKQALEGNVYLMDSSVADQLEKKVFTKRIHSKVNEAIKKAKAIATTLVMSSPVQLLDRMINFPMFDIGVTGSADVDTFKYMPTAISTVTKFIQGGDYLTDDDIAKDNNMKLLLRFLSAQGNLDIKNATIRGERISLTNTPGIRQYLKLVNTMYQAGNLIPRFAYFMNLVNSADINYKIAKNKTGVAYHLYDSIVGVEGDKATGIKSYIDNPEKTPYYKEFGENAKNVADLDAQAVQIIAEHNGIEGNMPYAARWLNENYNTMFLTFPMALMRWGKNRLQSLGYAFMESDSTDVNYLLNQAKSVLVTQTILLAIQILLSQNTQEYLKKKLTGKDDEITEEEEENAQNILFRGGCVKLFDTALKGEEVTTTAQNRGPASGLFNSYVADFIPAFNNGQNFMTTLKNQLVSHTWGHVPFVVKDTVESIPGNTALQSASWYVPGNNFFENYGRKILGYNLGSTQANAFIDYLQAHNANNDLNESSVARLRNAMSYAFSKKYSNLKSNKSEVRNYKKAFELVYNYLDTVYGGSSTTSTSTNKDLKSELRKAVETSNSSADVYYTIQRAISKGSSYSDIQKALNSISLRERLLTLRNYNAFIDSLDSSEKATIKTALLYEEENYPYLEDILTDVNNKAHKEYLNSNASYSSRNIASILKGMTYNTPTYYNYNSNRNNYISQARFLNNYNKSYSNYQRQQQDAYERMRNIVDYGVSKDIWGTETQHYKDGTSYTKRDRGYNPFTKGGNK